MLTMRRVSALLLIALFSFSLISPALFASNADANLPACCRREGKHHCAMIAVASNSSSGPALQATRCPFFPKAFAAYRTAGLGAISLTLLPTLVSQSPSDRLTESLCRSSYSRAGQKRGPPSFLS